MAPLCSGLARRPLKAVARVRIPSGLPMDKRPSDLRKQVRGFLCLTCLTKAPSGSVAMLVCEDFGPSVIQHSVFNCQVDSSDPDQPLKTALNIAGGQKSPGSRGSPAWLVHHGHPRSWRISESPTFFDCSERSYVKVVFQFLGTGNCSSRGSSRVPSKESIDAVCTTIRS